MQFQRNYIGMRVNNITTPAGRRCALNWATPWVIEGSLRNQLPYGPSCPQLALVSWPSIQVYLFEKKGVKWRFLITLQNRAERQVASASGSSKWTQKPLQQNWICCYWEQKWVVQLCWFVSEQTKSLQGFQMTRSKYRRWIWSIALTGAVRVARVPPLSVPTAQAHREVNERPRNFQ